MTQSGTVVDQINYFDNIAHHYERLRGTEIWPSLLRTIRSVASNARRVFDVATSASLASPGSFESGCKSTVFQESPLPGSVTDGRRPMPADSAGLPVTLWVPRATGSVGMKCLIIAAGAGSRLGQNGSCKPLMPILGVSLIERVIRSALEGGADDFYVVTGYQSRRVHDFLSRLTDRLGIRITPIVNEDWEKDNGLSVLKAQKYLRGPFLLLMADHLFDPTIAHELMKYPLTDGEIILAVDGNTENSLIDIEDVTRVKTEGTRLRYIGKGLKDFNGFDTGIFLCRPSIFGALERCRQAHGDTTLTGAVRLLAGEDRVKAVYVTGYFVMDVDDPPAFKRAENALLAQLGDKPNDGPVSYHLNRPLSVRISRQLVNYPVTPNQISLFSFLCSMLAAGLFSLGSYPTLLLGGLLAQFASVIDGCDGEVARLKLQGSLYGGWLDAVLDRYADAFLLFGLTWHAYAYKMDGFVLLVGFLAIIGSFMVSYTAEKYDNRMRGRWGKGLRVGRDFRVFLIFLGALLNQPYLTLLVLAIVMNIETIRRVIVCRDHG
ncbi:NTP transferase domain-containing protein [Acidobacteria bacterium AH-259-D05]|nr:NTP transferase domain-containing protein [Acidobacteria bacterium AH-259-D05]